MSLSARTPLASIATVILVLILSTVGSGPARAQDPGPGGAHAIALGPRLGVELRGSHFAIGGEARFGLVQIAPIVRLDLRPIFNFYFISDVTVFDLGAEALFAFDVKQDLIEPYAGAGLSVGHSSFSSNVLGVNANHTDVGLSLVAGTRFLQRQRIQPFAEIRIGAGSYDPIMLAGGVLFVL